jgi:hypothetical protein
MGIHVLKTEATTGDGMKVTYQIDNVSYLANLPTDKKYYGSIAHTPGYAQIWELGANGWIEM